MMSSKHSKLFLFAFSASILGGLSLIAAASSTNARNLTGLFVIAIITIGLVGGTLLSLLGALHERERALNRRSKKLVQAELRPLREAVDNIIDDQRTALADIESIGSNAQSIQTTTAEGRREVLELLRKDVSQASVLGRVQAAEKRLLAALETTSLDHGDHLATIAEELRVRSDGRPSEP